MTSNINPAFPEAGQATTESVRQNFAAAKSEIEALQAAGGSTPLSIVDFSASLVVAGITLVASKKCFYALDRNMMKLWISFSGSTQSQVPTITLPASKKFAKSMVIPFQIAPGPTEQEMGYAVCTQNGSTFALYASIGLAQLSTGFHEFGFCGEVPIVYP